MIYFLLVLLVVLFVLAFCYFRKDLVAPAVIFIAGFVYCAIWACFYTEDWDLVDMRFDTFWVIFGGAAVFLSTSIIVHLLFDKYSKVSESKSKSGAEQEMPSLKIPNWFKVVSIIFMIFTLFISLGSIIKISDSSWSELPAAISKYNNLVKFDSEVVKNPVLVTFFRMAAGGLTYWFSYVFVSNLFIKRAKWWKRIDFLSAVNVLLGLIVLLSTGSRNGAVNVLIAAITIFILLYYKKYHFNLRVKIKWFLPILIIFSLFLVLFPKINVILGRGESRDATYYLAIYSGAEIKNLDIFLNNRASGGFESSGNNQTFAYIINTVMKTFNFGVPYKLDIPFQQIVNSEGRTFTLGNVYTTYYQFIYDYGFLGMVWCTMIAAAVSQFIYEKCRRAILKDVPDIYILIYGFLSSSLLLSFFSNKFYEQNFNKALIFNVVFWIILNYFISKNFYIFEISKKFCKGSEIERKKTKNVEKR